MAPLRFHHRHVLAAHLHVDETGELLATEFIFGVANGGVHALAFDVEVQRPAIEMGVR